LELVFKLERVFCIFQNSILTSFFCNFQTQKQEIISELISELVLQNFREFEKFGFFWKNSELQKPNISQTRKNEKFGNFCLTQGLNLCASTLFIKDKRAHKITDYVWQCMTKYIAGRRWKLRCWKFPLTFSFIPIVSRIVAFIAIEKCSKSELSDLLWNW